MKKIISIVLLGSILLVACGDSNVGASLGRLELIGQDKLNNQSGRDSMMMFRDKETGCQYIYADGTTGVAIQPVLNSEGKPYCPQK